MEIPEQAEIGSALVITATFKQKKKKMHVWDGWYEEYTCQHEALEPFIIPYSCIAGDKQV